MQKSASELLQAAAGGITARGIERLPHLGSVSVLVLLLSVSFLRADASFATSAIPSPPSSHTQSDALAEALRVISGSRMTADVARLSDPSLNGRQTATPDDFRSGLLIVERFQSLGLHPVGDWMMVEPRTARRIEGLPTLEFSIGEKRVTARLASEYLPILDSPAVRLSAPVVFVGYGISDPAQGFDEYSGVDVQGRIALFLRGKPEKYARPVPQAEKEQVAREKGAAGYLMLTGPVLNAYESRRGLGGRPLAAYNHSDSEEGLLPGAWISTELAETIFPRLGRQGASLREVQERLNQMLVESASTDVVAHMAWESTRMPGSLNNVLGLIPGRDPALAGETVIIGAHRDHFGRQAGLLFPGADDNASGTAVMLEVARAFSQPGLTPKRSILFVSFSGEEQGLLGSRLYTSRPPRPLQTTVAMINIDHAGVGNGRITVGITGISKEAAQEAGQRAGLAEMIDLFGFFPGGDHVPFKEAGVPTIAVVSGGVHPQFHQPTDTVQTIQPAILERVAHYVLALAWQLANKP